jgi:UDP-hydrolysing UDP-N-acetyl-D-glucosamine 2-epimerase
VSSVARICVVTGSRAEYGLLYWLLKELDDDSAFDLRLIVTGMHLSPEFGNSISQIRRDGFDIDAIVESQLSSDTSTGITKSVGVGVIGFADAFRNMSPDAVIVLGDRFETFAAAQAAMFADIPIVHIHGGETSEGAFDEAIRHSITKMAHLHFVAAEAYRKRVIQLGESPDRVENVGAAGLDHLQRTPLLDRGQLEKELGLKLSSPLFLVTYHPVTVGDSDPAALVACLLDALDRFDATIVLTYPNADTGGRSIITAIDSFVARREQNRKAFASLGQQRYLSLMRIADVVIGNSSSGLIEAPALKRPTVNIGERQKGRLKATSVIDARDDAADIERAIRLVLSDDFRRGLGETISLYGHGNAAQSMVARLKHDLPLSTRKVFFDIVHGH